MADFEQAGATERLRRVAILRDMQAKLKRSPLEALGVVAGAGPTEVRSAFMALTKQYHPAKFARLDEATVKLANEVFLDLREAYESLQAAATSKRARTIPGPGVADVETPRKPEPAGQASAQASQSSHANAGAPRPGQVTRPAEPARTEPRPAVGRASLAGAASPSSHPSSVAGSSVAGSSVAGSVGGRAASLHPAGSASSASRAPGPAAGAPAGPPTRPSAPSISTSAIASASGSGSGSSSAAASAAAATAAAKPAHSSHSSAVPNATGAPKIRFGNAEAPELVRIRGLINRQQWTDARNALQLMLQRVPTDRGSMAQLAYVRAREALELGNVSEARRELVRALAIEPTMEQARSALNELNDLNPSKPSSNPPAPRR